MITAENLSLFMRQINSNYAKYYNKKYKRSGYLWYSIGNCSLNYERYHYNLL